jgi:succinoglycan biosynthesis transport protein ExoP
MDLISVIRALRNRLWVLIVFPLISVVCAIFLVSRMEKIYKSTAMLATGFTSDEIVRLSDDRTSNQFEINTKFTNTIESMKSIPVMSLVSYRLILHDLSDSIPFRRLKEENEFLSVLNSENRENLIKIFQSKLNNLQLLNSLDPGDQLAYTALKAYRYDHENLNEKFSIARKSISDFINVEFQSENPLLSAFAVNTLCQEFLRFNKSLKTDRSSESVEFLENLMVQKRQKRDSLSVELNDFKVRNNIFNYSAESASKITQISNYEASRETEEKNISALTLSLEVVSNKIRSFTKIDQNEIAKVNQRIIDLRRRIDELNSAEGEAARLKLNQLRDELQLEIARLQMMSSGGSTEEYNELLKERDRLQLDLQIAKSNLLTINETLARLRAGVTGLASKEARLAELERDLLIASNEYQNAQDRYNAAVNKASAIGSSLKQIIEGQPSKEPESSKAIFLVALAGLGSFMVSAIVVLMLEFANFEIRNQNRLEAQTGLKSIATLNEIKVKLLDLQKIFHGHNEDKDVDVFIHFIRKFRFEIQSSNSQVILVTSTKANVGKSFLIVCLSYTLSLINKRVLIIDTNFKSSSLTKLLIPNIDGVGLLKKGKDSEPALLPEEAGPSNGNNGSTKGGGTKDSNDDPQPAKNGKTLIYKTRFQGVDIIGNFGGGKDSPSEILAGKDFKKMLDNLSLQYDYVLLEGPSLNDYSDTRELIEYVDKVIAVFDADTTLTELDHDSIKYLKSIKEKLLGSVLNRVKLKELTI